MTFNNVLVCALIMLGNAQGADTEIQEFTNQDLTLLPSVLPSEPSLVDKDSYLLELARYIVLNPVRAQMVRSARDWRWSSYRASAGLIDAPDWLHTDWLLSCFGARLSSAREKFADFVAQGRHQPSPWESLKNQIFLGDEQFVQKVQAKVAPDRELTEIPRAQKRKPPAPLATYANKAASRDTAICQAYASGAYSMREIGEHFELHYSSASKIIKHADQSE